MPEHKKPWYVDLVKEIGGLGLVLIMLVGLYLLAQDFGNGMKTTWQDIKEISNIDLQESRTEREHVRKTISEFVTNTDRRLTEQAKRMTEHSDRMTMFEERLNRLSSER